jgi:pSer/pThr/pTyr-binding forkhead associated (FHA) protein
VGQLTRIGSNRPPDSVGAGDGRLPAVIELGRRTVFGRLPPSDVLLDDDSMSRHHAVVMWRDDHYEILDLESLNGTRVDGRRLERGEVARLRVGTEISFGLGRCAWRMTSDEAP